MSPSRRQPLAKLSTSSKHGQIISGLIGVGVVVVLLASASPAVKAAWQRNMAGIEFAAQLARSDGVCNAIPSEAIVRHLARAVELQPSSIAAWRALIRIKGLSDRRWLAEKIQKDAGPALLDAASLLLSPTPMRLDRPWDTARCTEAWAAWTAGLVQSKLERWEAAVALYQAGLGMAPGRAPAEIIQEYYVTLARYILAAEGGTPARQLAAAKYLALAGEAEDATGIFHAIRDNPELSIQQKCQVAEGLAWLQAGDKRTAGAPPWPVSLQDGACAQMQEDAPAWAITQGPAVREDASGKQLIGFDLDEDILDAGAEVVGILYWQTGDGALERQPLRQPDLWPNSGNRWLPLADFWACLPGYIEPPWVTPCASQPTAADETAADPNGMLFNEVGRAADAFIATATLSLHQDHWVLFGGRWRREGQFPRGHVARMATTGRYDAVLDLSNLPFGTWQAIASSVEPLAHDEEFSFWIRPRAGIGEGALWFDDVFSFELPE